MALANAMGHKENLKQFILDCNQFGDEGVDQISQIMEDYGKLDILSIEDDEGLADEEEDQDGKIFLFLYFQYNTKNLI